MKFDFLLNNIGPINSARVSLRDLTVLVGMNSIGKSLISKSAYLSIKGLLSSDKELVRLVEMEVYKPELYKRREDIRLQFLIDDVTAMDLSFDPLVVHGFIPDQKIADITYVDGPLVINEPVPSVLGNSHDDDLKKKLVTRKEGFVPMEHDGAIREINALLEEVLEEHRLVYKEEKRGLYLTVSEELMVSLKKAPNGLKSFIILRELLANGYLSRGSVLVLDEPEILSHPSWQLAYAHILARIIRQLGVKVMINTCSMYFIEALEMYSNSYKLDSDFYLGVKDDGGYTFVNQESDLQEIYNALLEPYEKLDDLRMAYSEEEE